MRTRAANASTGVSFEQVGRTKNTQVSRWREAGTLRPPRHLPSDSAPTMACAITNPLSRQSPLTGSGSESVTSSRATR